VASATLSCGQNCPNPGPITATITGDLTGNFYGKDANYFDWVRVIDTTANTTSDWGLLNQTSQRGDSFNFGHVTAGDNLVIQLCSVPDSEGHSDCRPNDDIFATDPSYSADGFNHALVSYLGGDNHNQLVRWYLWFEDFDHSLWGLPDEPDFNDEVIYFNGGINISLPQGNAYDQVATPEPASFVLLGSGLVGVFYRRQKRNAR
jgi:hypothetical protein